MNLLALDTSSEWCSVAVWIDGHILSREEQAGQRHSELIIPMVDAVLAQARIGARALQAIAFGAGPGSFTGLRIGCGVAQGLAFAAGLRVVPVSTLEALAEAAGGARVISALDARMGEVYLGAYERARDGWHAVVAPCLCTADAAPAIDGEGWAGCGSGFGVHGNALAARYAGQLARVDSAAIVHAAAIAAVGARLFSSGGGVEPEHAAPLYVRDKIALTVAERAARRPSAGEAPR